MSGGQAGWFDQFYEPESLVDQLVDMAYRMVAALYDKTAEDLAIPFGGPDPEPGAAHDLVDQLGRALELTLLAELRRLSASAAAPQTVAALPVFLVEQAVERCRSLVIDGEPGRHYPHHRALYLDDMGTDWSTTIGVRELADWVAHEGLSAWITPAGAACWGGRAERRCGVISATTAARLLRTRTIVCVHVEQGDHPRLEHGYEQAELCLDDGSIVLLDAKDSTWIGQDTDLAATVDGRDDPALPRVLQRLVGRRIDDASAIDPAGDCEFGLRLRVAESEVVLTAHGEGSSIEYSASLLRPSSGPSPLERGDR